MAKRTRRISEEEQVRLLPGDFTKKLKYSNLDNTEKNVIKEKGFFTLPTKVKGEHSATRNFLVFYFDDVKDYTKVRAYFEIQTTKKLSHPELNSKKLINIIPNG